MSRGRRYVVLGCGRQGTAAALDLALRGGAGSLVLADASAGAAEGAAAWLAERLRAGHAARGAAANKARGAAADVGRGTVADTGRGTAAEPEPVSVETAVLDVSDGEALRALLAGAAAAVCAVPYRHILGVSRAAIDAGVPACDLGGHPDTVRSQLELDGPAREAGVSLVPDCGQAPGMATSLMALAMGMVEEPERLELWDGGLPVDPEPPLHYRLTFDVRGLTNEYDGPCWNIRDGQPVALEALTEVQEVEFPPPLGRLEAFVASGTGSTFPWTHAGTLHEFTSRIVRWPGHLEAMRTLKELGFLSLAPVEVGGREVVPRRVTEALLEPLLVGEGPIRDVVVVRVHCTGRAAGRPVRAEVDLMVRHDPATGLTAMQRCTGFDAAIVAAMLAGGEIAPGVAVRERSVDPARYVEELARRKMAPQRRVVDA